jgi:hypothetical protein
MRHSRLTNLFLTLAACWLIAAPADALTMTVDSMSVLAGHTADHLTGTTSELRTLMSILDAGGSTADVIGNDVIGSTRYASSVSINESGAGASNNDTTTNYRITFTVDGEGAATYDVTIDTTRIGAFTLVSDPGGADASASMSGVTGTSSEAGTGSLDLALLGGLSGAGDQDLEFNQSGQFTITGLTGVTVINLDFTWDSTTFSDQHQAAIRMGLDGTIGAITADDYPGVVGTPRPIMGNDGHFVDITATVTAVPEPGTALLLTMGLIGLTISGRRRKR